MYPICHFVKDLGRWNLELNDSSSNIRSQCCFMTGNLISPPACHCHAHTLQQSKLNALECEIKSVWAPTDFLSWGLAWVADKAFSPGHCCWTLQHWTSTLADTSTPCGDFHTSWLCNTTVPHLRIRPIQTQTLSLNRQANKHHNDIFGPHYSVHLFLDFHLYLYCVCTIGWIIVICILNWLPGIVHLTLNNIWRRFFPFQFFSSHFSTGFVHTCTASVRILTLTSAH